jgi:subtilisin family serine protease
MTRRFRLPPFEVRACLTALAESIDWGLALLGVPHAWRQSEGEGVRLAVLDTGIDEDHPDLAAALDDARDFTGNRRGPIDGNGHGTHVAGTAAARRNDLGVVGVAPACRLLVAKVLGDDGSGDDRAVAAGVAWAVEAGADILSLSLGSPRPSALLREAVAAAAAKGRFVICAAGNSGEAARPGTRSSVPQRGRRTAASAGPQTRSGEAGRLTVFPRASTVDYPARWPETVAVAAVGRDGRVAPFSSRGDEVDIAAPGEDVLSTWLGGTFARVSGTSMAAPFVSGVAALALSKHRRQGGRTAIDNVEALLAHLKRTAIDAGPAGRDPAYGWGLVDPVSLLDDDPSGPPAPPPEPLPGGIWVWVPGGKVAALEANGKGA